MVDGLGHAAAHVRVAGEVEVLEEHGGGALGDLRRHGGGGQDHVLLFGVAGHIVLEDDPLVAQLLCRHAFLPISRRTPLLPLFPTFLAGEIDSLQARRDNSSLDEGMTANHLPES